MIVYPLDEDEERGGADEAILGQTLDCPEGCDCPLTQLECGCGRIIEQRTCESVWARRCACQGDG